MIVPINVNRCLWRNSTPDIDLRQSTIYLFFQYYRTFGLLGKS